MKNYIFVTILVMVARYSFAQIPFEVMVGNKQTLYFAYIQKDLDNIGRWNIFSQGLYAVNYRDSSLNSISIDNQLTYQFNNWLGISAGGSFDGVQFIPTLGLSLGYFNKKGDFSITAFPTIQLAKPRALDVFGLINYSPQFKKKWGLFCQLIIGTNLGVQKEDPNQKREILNIFTLHNISNQLIRVGLNYKQKFQFGIGADFAQFGMNEATFENFGLFLRYQLE
ncbi:hypothetical protein [Runella slithyformis]|uniref:Outer membrane protein beta-barrel domain-containing protein n=1 Tax=Runella slithyformis (strain ATCC 29530 / DSM 19594 / LMG 11500 / NCIMB 11436 / LSU 4) TaxID=761193 RepID=A0A7U4E8F1_RUNSL|nr:hypothetical protein [Runella slithyformis]AEI51384.1 hypothetical protein Runsl_5079 [Runella slithyformis DSM 19594]